MERYYIYDTVIRKNGVWKQIDTINKNVREFDVLGREVASYKKNDKEIYRCKYLNHNDTIVRVHYVTKGKIGYTPFEVEKYVYNKEKRVDFYLRFTSSSGRNEIDISKSKYDENNRISEIAYYYNSNYPHVISSNVPVVDSILKKGSVYRYFYDTGTNWFYKKQMTIKEELSQIDTFYLDNKGRLIKRVSFKREGYDGVRPASNVYHIEEFTYSTNVIITKVYGYYIDNQKKEHYNQTFETLYYPNKLVATISILEPGKKWLGSVYIYRHLKSHRAKHYR